jgi:hypothetical protein
MLAGPFAAWRNCTFAMNFLDATDSAGLTLRVQFVRRGDRYGHAILAVDLTGHESPLLESIEGTAAADWPPSPPLQNLSIHELSSDRRAALLVGMAGRSHWSASIEPVPGQAALVFDIACRTAGKCGPLGSQYRRLAQMAAEFAATAEFGSIAASDDQNCLSVAPPVSAPTMTGTVRWKYRLALRSPSRA